MTPTLPAWTRFAGLSGLLLVLSSSLPAQSAPAPASSTSASEDEPIMLEQFVSVGTRFDQRTVTESPVPIDIISTRDLQVGGQSDMGQMLAASVPSIFFQPNQTASDASFARPIRLRGLASNQLLILVNGKRRHGSAHKAEVDVIGIDINSLPPNAFGSVEVLRDGAAAQYGSDAIGGVLNFVLRSDPGTEFTTMYGQHYEGDGDVFETTLDAGTAWGRDGFLHASAYYRTRDGTNRQGTDKRQQYFGIRNGQPVIFGTVSATDNTPVLLPGDAFDPREATFDRNNNYKRGTSEGDEFGFVLNARRALTDTVTFSAFGGYSERETRNPYVFRRPLDVNNVRAIFPDGYQPIQIPEVDDTSLSVGLNGRAGEWDWELSETWGRNRVAIYPTNTVNATLGTASPTSFYAGGVGLQQASTNLDLKRSFDAGRPAPINFATGLEYRWENYWITAGEPDSYRVGSAKVLDGPQIGTQPNAGSQGYPGFRPSDEVDPTRDNIAVYLDAETKFADRLLLSAAARYENYSDAGSTLDGKIASRLELTPAIALRASASTGFRAPSLVESYYSQSPTLFVSGVSFITRHFPVSTPEARALGAKDLKPEESVAYSAGLTGSFGEALTLSVDFYQVEVTDQIVRTSLFNDAGTRAFLAANGFTDVAGATFFINGVDLQTRGLDFTARYSMKFAHGGTLTLTSALNLNKPEVTRVAPTPPELAAITTIPILDANRRISLELARPRESFNASARYEIGKWEAAVRLTRYGEYVSPGSTRALDLTFDAQWITDLDLSYRHSDFVTIGIGASNLFDIYPDKVPPDSNPSGVTQYSNGSPFGYNGGFYFTKITLRFK